MRIQTVLDFTNGARRVRFLVTRHGFALDRSDDYAPSPNRATATS
jgi:hypothetical protein